MINSIIGDNRSKLDEIEALLTQLTDDIFTKKKKIISNATVGQHTRHILEFYICLSNGMDKGEVSYDERNRDERIENKTSFAIDTIAGIKRFINSIAEDKPLVLKANYTSDNKISAVINSSLTRELAYALDHTIHHLAIVKIALMDDSNEVQVGDDFGVAPSTIRYRKLCAQ